MSLIPFPVLYREHYLWHSTDASSLYTPFFYDPEKGLVLKSDKPAAYAEIVQHKNIYDERHTEVTLVSGCGIGVVTPGEQVEEVVLCYLYY